MPLTTFIASTSPDVRPAGRSLHAVMKLRALLDKHGADVALLVVALLALAWWWRQPQLVAAVAAVPQQARQAQQAPPTDPSAQPGLSMPGMGAEAQPTAVPPPSPDGSNLSSLLSCLKRPVGAAAVK